MRISLSEPVSLDNLTQRTGSIIGGKGSGKTTTLKLFARSLDSCPVVIFDPLNVIAVKGYRKIVVSRKDAAKGAKMGAVLTRVKIDRLILGFNGLLQSEYATFLDDCFASWQFRDGMVIMDEIHEATPERSLGQTYAPEVERAVRHWRNANVGFISTTQRPSFCSKNVLALTDFAILYRITWKHDLEAITDMLNGHPETEKIIGSIQSKPFCAGYLVDFIPKSI